MLDPQESAKRSVSRDTDSTRNHSGPPGRNLPQEARGSTTLIILKALQGRGGGGVVLCSRRTPSTHLSTVPIRIYRPYTPSQHSKTFTSYYSTPVPHPRQANPVAGTRIQIHSMTAPGFCFPKCDPRTLATCTRQHTGMAPPSARYEQLYSASFEQRYKVEGCRTSTRTRPPRSTPDPSGDGETSSLP